jgi:nucleotide-binding universal stress UspA family protein
MSDHIVRRILATVSPAVDGRSPLMWSISIAQRCGARITGVLAVPADKWKQAQPSIMTAGYAARLLQMRPWQEASLRAEALRQKCEQLCLEAEVEFEAVELTGEHYEEGLLSQTRLHDLLVVELPRRSGESATDESVRAVEPLVRDGACPALFVPTSVFNVRRALIAYDGSAPAARAMQSFIHMRPWPDAAVEIACAREALSDAEATLSETAPYFAAHGVAVEMRPMEGDAERLTEHALSSGVDLIVAGASRGRSWGDKLRGKLLHSFVARSDVPLFIAQ